MTSDIRITPDVCLFLLEDEGVFFAESRQELHLFNTPAAFVWCCLEEGLAPADIVTAFATTFGVGGAEAEHHVSSVLLTWQGLGYLSGAVLPGAPETHLTTALGWLLTNPSLRADFTRSPADTAGTLRVRSADLEAFVTLDPDALEAEAESVARAGRRHGPARGWEHVLGSVSPSGRSVLELAADSRLRDIEVTSIRRYYELLATRFSLRLTSAAQEARVHPALAHLEIEEPAEVDALLDVLEADGGHVLLEDLLPVGYCADLDQLTPLVTFRVRQTAINRHPYFLAIHAGVVSNGEHCILLPGASGRGKTTLTAALSRVGFRYFSDEFALLEETTLHVRPVPLSLTIKRGAVGPLTAYYPELDGLPTHLREDGRTVRYLSPAERPRDPERSHAVRSIIFPHYDADAVTSLRPLSRPEALRRLLRECLVLPDLLDRAGVESLVRWIRTVDCFELPMSSLPDAVGLVKRHCGLPVAVSRDHEGIRRYG